MLCVWLWLALLARQRFGHRILKGLSCRFGVLHLQVQDRLGRFAGFELLFEAALEMRLRVALEERGVRLAAQGLAFVFGSHGFDVGPILRRDLDLGVFLRQQTLHAPHGAKGGLVDVRQTVDLVVPRWLWRQVYRSLGKGKGVGRNHAVLRLARLMHELRLLNCRQKVGLVQRELSGPQAYALLRVGVDREVVVLLSRLQLGLLLQDYVVHLRQAKLVDASREVLSFKVALVCVL